VPGDARLLIEAGYLVRPTPPAMFAALSGLIARHNKSKTLMKLLFIYF
jgi:hypothetical protein